MSTLPISNTELEKKQGIQTSINTQPPSGSTETEFINSAPKEGYLKQAQENYVSELNKEEPTTKDFIDSTYVKPGGGYSSGKLYSSNGKEVNKPTDKTNIIGYNASNNKRLSNNLDPIYNSGQYNSSSTMHEFDKTRFYNMDLIMGKNKLYNGNQIGPANKINKDQMDFTVVDAEWIQSRYMVPDSDMDQLDVLNRYFSSTGWKYGSTRLGHSMAINVRPQFTRFADIKGNSRLSNIVTAYGTPEDLDNDFNLDSPFAQDSVYEDVTVHMMKPASDTSRVAGENFGYGMGRYYSESIDDNATTIFMEFGLPKFNSMINYFTRAIDGEDSMVANYGYVPFGYKAGRALGRYAIFCAFPLMTIMIWVTKAFVNFLATGPFNYYYMKPAMVQYWGVVNLIVNQMMSELGIFSPELTKFSNNEKQANKIGMTIKLDNADLADLSKYMPGVFNGKSAYLDVYAIAQSAQMVTNRMQEYEYDAYNLLEHMMSRTEGKDGKLDIQMKNGKGYLFKNITNSAKRWPGGKVWADLDMYCRFSYWRKQLFSTGDGKDKVMEYNPETGEYESDDSIIEPKRGNRDMKGLYHQRGANDGSGNTVAIDGTNINNDTDALYQADKAMNLDGKSKEEQQAIISELVETEVNANKDENGNIKNSPGLRTNSDGSYSFIPNDDETDETLGATEKLSKWLTNTGDWFDSAIRGGGTYAIFNVDYTGSVNDSVSNSYSDIDTGGLLNSVSQGARNMKFNLAGGNIFGEMQKTITDNVVSFLHGSLDGVSWGLSNVVRTLLGGGYVDIPKKWDDSDVNIGKCSYTIDLVAPYGNVISQIQNVYIPLAMLLAGSLPLATGKASYTSPFLCSVFNKGVQEIKLGMITSLSIERGTANTGFTRNKRALGFRVSFEVSDFSNIATAPVKAGIIDNIFDFSLEDDTPFGNYIGVLCSRDLYSSKYLVPKLKKKLSRINMAISQTFSSAAMGMRLGHTLEPVFGLFSLERNINLQQLNDYRNY